METGYPPEALLFTSIQTKAIAEAILRHLRLQLIPRHVAFVLFP